jgi:O-acetyl-ADP-ribose deacetylase (regulator of RNase III)
VLNQDQRKSRFTIPKSPEFISTEGAILYRRGDATEPVGDGNKIICHCCNDLGLWGRGFVLAISRRWKEPEAEFRRWNRDRVGFALGEIQMVQVEEELWVANMIGQHGVGQGAEGPPIRYEALRSCLEKVTSRAKELSASVHMPRIGCGLAGGKWENVEPLLIETLYQAGVFVSVYDL